jgi:hypothetical protein
MANGEILLKFIEKAKTACFTSGFDTADHFLEVFPDVRENLIAIAQSYFAVQTRKQELESKKWLNMKE